MSIRSCSNRRLTRTLIAALLLVVVLVAAAPAAFASGGPSCWGASCRGKDPRLQGCSRDAVTLATIPHPGTAGAGYNQVTELRHSPACHAYWSRVTSRLAPGDIKYTRASILGHVSSTRVVHWGAKQSISKMWTGPATACGVSVSKSDPGYLPVGCAP